jgi:hypothetical protein
MNVTLTEGVSNLNKEWRSPKAPQEQRFHTRRPAPAANRQNLQIPNIPQSLRFRETQILSVIGHWTKPRRFFSIASIRLRSSLDENACYRARDLPVFERIEEFNEVNQFPKSDLSDAISSLILGQSSTICSKSASSLMPRE